MSHTPSTEYLKESSFQEDESGSIIDQFKKKPHVFIGMGGLLFAVGFGVQKYRKGTIGNIPLSLHIIQTRVIAQSAALGCIFVGMMYHMYNEHIAPALKKGKD